MKSIDVANALIERCGREYSLTNLKLNKLVYFAQVEALREDGLPLFSDTIEAWEYGPVEPMVYHAFKRQGRSPISNATETVSLDARAEAIVQKVIEKYAGLTSYDLVNLSHEKGGAWEKAYAGPYTDRPITNEIILSSLGIDGYELKEKLTLASGIHGVEEKWPNALRMLEDA